jgi:general secretion pathway protein G
MFTVSLSRTHSFVILLYMNRASQSGFSIMELLIIIAIIGILAATVLSNIGGAREKAKLAKAKVEVRNLEIAIQSLGIDSGLWPGAQELGEVACGGTDDVIDDLTTPEAGLVQSDSSFTQWNGPYMPEVPLDPWGHNYFFDTDYTINGQTAVVVGSYGPNGVGANLYDADDIIRVIVEPVSC